MDGMLEISQVWRWSVGKSDNKTEMISLQIFSCCFGDIPRVSEVVVVVLAQVETKKAGKIRATAHFSFIFSHVWWGPF